MFDVQPPIFVYVCYGGDKGFGFFIILFEILDVIIFKLITIVKQNIDNSMNPSRPKTSIPKKHPPSSTSTTSQQTS